MAHFLPPLLMELFSFHVQVLKLRASGSVDWDPDAEEEEQDAAPIGFGSAVVEAPDLEDGDGSEDRLGFRH
jgi:hypothetical protein